MDRCSTTAKNAAYALAVVEDAIDRLDSIRSEQEWRDIMRDLTNGYKLVNAISTGTVFLPETEWRSSRTLIPFLCMK